MSAQKKELSRRRFLGTVGATVVGAGKVAADVGIAANGKSDAPATDHPEHYAK